MPKYPFEYTKPEVADPNEIYRPQYRFDSRGRLVMPWTPYQKMTLTTSPGSKNVLQSSESEGGGPQLDPAAIKTGYLYADTLIKCGPKGGWVISLAGGDATRPIQYGHETTKEVRFYLDNEGNVYLKGKLVAGPDSEVDWSYLQNIAVKNIHIAETLTIGNTEAQTTIPDANFKDMAFEDLVELAKLGTTIFQGGYLKTILIDAEYIQAGIITGRLVRTAASGGRVEMVCAGGYSDYITFYNPGGALTGYITAVSGTNTLLIGNPNATTPKILFNVGGVQMVTFYPGYADMSAMKTREIYPEGTGSRDIGTSSLKYRNFYLSGNIYADGTIISAHVDIKADGYIKRVGTNYVRLTSTYFDLYKPIGLNLLAADPAAYEGGLYKNTAVWSDRFRGHDGSGWRDICFFDERNDASPIPTFASGLDQLKKIKDPIIVEEKLILNVDSFPKEFRPERNGKVIKGHIDLKKVIGMLIKGQKELLQKVEILENSA